MEDRIYTHEDIANVVVPLLKKYKAEQAILLGYPSISSYFAKAKLSGNYQTLLL